MSSSPHSLERFGPADRKARAAALAGLLLAGLALRLWLAPRTGHLPDIRALHEWGNLLLTRPLADFYGLATPAAVYLPGYQYLLLATMRVGSLATGGPPTEQQFLSLVKVVPIASDMLLAVAVYLLCRRVVGPVPSVVASGVALFDPGLLFVSAVWGQVDSVAAAPYMMALAALLSGNPVAAAVWSALGFQVKAQYALFLLLPGLAYLRRETSRLASPRSRDGLQAWASWGSRKVLLPCAVALALTQLLLLPFSLSVLPVPEARWTLIQRIGMLTDQFPTTSANAFNLWATPMFGMWLPDSTLGWLGLSFRSWGSIMLVALLVGALAVAWRRPSDEAAIVWASYAVMLGMFVLSTRMHERYLFMAVPLAIVGAALDRRLTPLYVGTSVLYLVNVWYAYFKTQPELGTGGLTRMPDLPSIASAFGVVLLIGCLAVLAALVVPVGERQRAEAARATRRADDEPKARRIGPWLALVRGLMLMPTRWKVALLLVVFGGVFGGFLVGRLADEAVVPVSAHGARVAVRADRSWQDTRLRVEAGQRISISVRGQWTHQKGMIASYGPAGAGKTDAKCIVPSAPVGAVLGRIGDSEPFVVGASATRTAPASGTIQLAMNDWPDGYGDNEGSVEAVIALVED